MPLLQVKDCPESTYEALRRRAAQDHRSIAQETLYIVEEYLAGRAPAAAPEPQPAPRRWSYAPDPHDTTDYAAKRRKLFAEIESWPAYPVTENFPSAADILAEARREDAR